ncbi:hypothetical protein AKJ16_DCAP20845, partial [Drosera capensis]
MRFSPLSSTNTFTIISLLVIIFVVSSSTTMAENSKHESGGEGAEGEEDCKAAVYIVYTEQPLEGVDAETHHLRTLSSVLGSEEAAKDALIYVYKTAATGFSAKLTPEQVAELS